MRRLSSLILNTALLLVLTVLILSQPYGRAFSKATGQRTGQENDMNEGVAVTTTSQIYLPLVGNAPLSEPTADSNGKPIKPPRKTATPTRTSTPTPTFTPTPTRTPTATATDTPAPNSYPLDVTRQGAGVGTVSSLPLGIACGNDCNESYLQGTAVVLTASAGAGSSFVGWSGDCSGAQATCNLTMSRAMSVRAEFTLAVSQNPFDALYPSDFTLQPISADAIPLISKPTVKATGLNAPSYIDPVYGAWVYRVTSATDFQNATFVRHDYSRRQAFNADNSRFVATTSNGFWLLYDANTFTRLERTGYRGALNGLAGDCEVIWHPSDPRKLWYKGSNSLQWFEKDVESDSDTLLVDFTGRLPWSQATNIWTKGEGTSSADGRYWAFMATHYDSENQHNYIFGLFTWDRKQDTIIGTYDAANFGGAFPDHISISPSGKYAVPSWAFTPTLGTRAFALDFSSSRLLHEQTEHSDLAIGPNGEDYYVVADYTHGVISAMDMATGASFDLMRLYPTSGESYAAHISGKAYDRPGWVVLSTYADSAEYGGVTPAPYLRPMYRKIMLVELKPGGKQYNIAHTRTAANYGGYWGEPQATISRDGSRILFSSNFDDGGDPDAYMIGLPSWVYTK